MEPVLAHQGGWDEILFVLVPIVVFATLLLITSRRARNEEAETGGEPADDGEAAAPDPDRRA